MFTTRKSVQIVDECCRVNGANYRWPRAIRSRAVNLSGRRLRSGHRAAFTLVEIMIVVVIIGLLAALALPAFLKVQEQSRASRFANDFRQFEAAYQRFFMEGNPRPPVTGGGITPAGMSGYLPAAYNETSALGGYYWWSGPSGAIVLLGSTADDTMMRKVDVILDDGDLTTGTFQKIGGGYGLLVR